MFGALSISGTAVTPGGNLGCKWIVHTNTPAWDMEYQEEYFEGKVNSKQMLEFTVLNCLYTAKNILAKSVALPPMSIGAKGFPIKDCAEAMIRSCFAFATLKPSHTNCINHDERGHLETIKIMITDNSVLKEFQSVAKKAICNYV